MLTNRARGLANLHLAVITLCEGAFFWLYALIIYHVHFVRLSREVNLVPYFLCVVGGLVASGRELSRIASRFHLLELGEAARLATRQVGFVALLTFAMMFATQDHSISRLFLGSFMVWSLIGLTALNAWLPGRLARMIFQRGRRLPTVFVGRKSAISSLHDWIRSREGLGIHPLGFLSDDELPMEACDLPAPHLGGRRNLAQVLKLYSVGQVILLEFPESDVEARKIIEACRDHGARLLIHNNIEDRYTHPLVPVAEDGHHFYALQDEPLEDPFNRLIKRSYDLAISIPIVVFVLPPLCFFVWCCQRAQSPGPLMHSRDRKGLQGRVFRMHKFRSMIPAPPDASAEAKQAETVDDRIFPLGRFLRKTSLDEFPQFWNVLVGDMSVVGPRPYMPLLDEEFRRQTEGHRTRYLVKPGITGLAQSLGFRGAILEHEMITHRLKWDVHYVTHWSIWLDLQITVRTLIQVVRPPKTAY